MMGRIEIDGSVCRSATATNTTEEYSSVNWVEKVSCKDVIRYNEGAGKKVVLVDCGVKANIIRCLIRRGVEVIRVPWNYDYTGIDFDGLFLANGPGDPEPCDYAINAIRELVDQGIPTFGICLGHQLLGLASGARTMKMKFGHHGANHPVKDLKSGRVMITSQNHGFAIDENTLPENIRVTHVSLFDGSVQGIERTDRPAFSFQGHPEASPGPHDVTPLFEHFIELIKARKESR
jgi:carbamoyl-phosphate synthase small subunit